MFFEDSAQCERTIVDVIIKIVGLHLCNAAPNNCYFTDIAA